MRPQILSTFYFSEGQQTDLIDTIVDAMARAGGVHLVDVTSDPHQNRTSISLVGLPMEVEKAIATGIKLATTHINMDIHQGEHPRFGAADTVSFTPLRDITLEQCTSLAHRLGQRIADELRIAVYYFGSAALRPTHEFIGDICHTGFQYEELRDHIRIDPAWMPDTGPAELSEAGACLVGSHLPIIECVVVLNDADPAIIQKIAQAVDFSTGGLRYVRCFPADSALKLTLSDYSQTPVHRVIELIEREAHRHRVTIQSIQLVGLVPEKALLDSAGWYLRLHNFNPDYTLEYRIRQAEAEPTPLAEEEPPIPEDATSQIILPSMNETRRPEQFAVSVAQASPTPGGGAVSAQVGALAAALTEMVAGLTIGKKAYQSVEAKMSAIQTAAYQLRSQLLDAVSQDIDAFNNLLESIRSDKSDPDYESNIQRDTLTVADVPMKVIRLAYEVLELLEQVVEMGNRNAVIDAAVGARMALAVIEGSALNVRVNLMSITDEDIISRYRDELHHLVEEAKPLCASIIETAAQRAGLTEDF